MADRPYVDFAEVKKCVGLPEVLEVLGIAGQFTFTKGPFRQGESPWIMRAMMSLPVPLSP